MGRVDDMSNERLEPGDFVIYYEGRPEYIGQLAQVIEVTKYGYTLKFGDNHLLFPTRLRRLLKHTPTEEQLAIYLTGLMKS